jgi:pimeloyl-ACP methyl ester carboxylesterase
VTSATDTGEALLVLHDIGDGAGGAPWRMAFDRAGWPGPVLAPDLPGHGGAPAPLDGVYELSDAALTAVRLFGEAGPGHEPPVVVGVGVNGWSAQVLALGNRAAGLVLVDGLNGPWADPATVIGSGRRWLRAIADDPAAVALAPTDGLDPRLRHGVAPHRDRRLAERAAAALPVPVLLVETAESPVTAADRDDIAARIQTVTVLELEARGPTAVAEHTVSWWMDRPGSSTEC